MTEQKKEAVIWKADDVDLTQSEEKKEWNINKEACKAHGTQSKETIYVTTGVSEGKEKGTESIFKWLTLMGEGGRRVQNSSYKMSQFWGT